MPHGDLDSIVIGGGIAGLAAAAYLARGGKQTLLVEQHSRPGGYWTSFTRHGVIFDITPHWTLAPETVNALLADHGVAPLVFEQHAHVGRFIGPSPQWDVWVSTRPRFEASVLASFPTADRQALARLIELCQAVYAEIEAVPSPNLELMHPLARLAFTLTLPFKLKRLLRYTRTPAEKFLNSYFPGDELAGLRTSLYLTAPIPGMTAVGLLAMLGTALAGRAHSPVGGAQTIGDAFAAAAQRSGAEIRYSARVRRILLAGGKAAGVELEDGSTYRARTVVAAVDARQIYYELLDPALLPQAFAARLNAYPPSEPYVIVSLVTDLDPAAYGFDGTDTFLAASADLGQGLAPNAPEQAVLELVFPRYRSPGADPRYHGIQLVSPATFDHADHWAAGPALLRGEAYRRYKEEYAAAMIARAETRLPGLGEHIITCDVATPLTMQRYTLNQGGAPIGWGYKNPLRWQQRVPFISGLYQAGHWVGPSGVVSTATSGKHAAELVLRDLARR